MLYAVYEYICIFVNAPFLATLAEESPSFLLFLTLLLTVLWLPFGVFFGDVVVVVVVISISSVPDLESTSLIQFCFERQLLPLLGLLSLLPLRSAIFD